MKSIRIEIKWAVVFSITVLAWMIAEKASGLHDIKIEKHELYSGFFAIPAILVYVFALLDKKRNYFGGKMAYKEAFQCGLRMTIIIAMLSPLTQLITAKIISPDFFNNMINYAVNKKIMSPEQAADYFSLGSYMIQGFVGAVGMGVITSAIVAYFVRSRG